MHAGVVTASADVPAHSREPEIRRDYEVPPVIIARVRFLRRGSGWGLVLDGHVCWLACDRGHARQQAEHHYCEDSKKCFTAGIHYISLSLVFGVWCLLGVGFCGRPALAAIIHVDVFISERPVIQLITPPPSALTRNQQLRPRILAND